MHSSSILDGGILHSGRDLTPILQPACNGCMAKDTDKMGLHTWDRPLDPYDYIQLTQNWQILSFHDHTEGRGVQIPMGGIAPGAVGMTQLASSVSTQFPSLVTVLPSGTDGQVVDFLADATNGVIWRFRYRQASASTFKWEFVGGPAMRAFVTTSESTSSTVAVSLATPLTLTIPALPNGGDFDVTVGGTLTLTATSIPAGQTLAGETAYVVGAGALERGAWIGMESNTDTTQLMHTVHRAGRRAAIPGGSVLTVQYLVVPTGAATGTLTASDRYIEVKPIRVG